jgi:GDP-4-dehydro-6-deoxy-D-mannose reductase
MRALITGINGFVGGHLAEHLLDAGWEVVGISSSGATRLPSLAERVRIYQINLMDAHVASVPLEHTKPDVIFHLAAQAHVPTAVADPAGTLTNNLLAQLNLLDAVRASALDPVVVVACTSEEYGAVRPDDLPVDEDTPLRPGNPYALSKVCQDMLALQHFIAHRTRTVRLRLFNHIGPRQSPSYVVAAFARQIAMIERGEQEPVVQVGNLEARRDFTDVRDVVRAYELAATHGEAGEVYNIGSGTAVEIRQILDMLIALSGHAIEVEVDPARVRPVDVPVIACDASRFRTRTGWRPLIPLEQSLADVLDEWRHT